MSEILDTVAWVIIAIVGVIILGSIVVAFIHIAKQERELAITMISCLVFGSILLWAVMRVS